MIAGWGAPQASNTQAFAKQEAHWQSNSVPRKQGLQYFCNLVGFPMWSLRVNHCGWRREDPKHIIVFSLNYALYRHELYEVADGQTDTKKISVNWKRGFVGFGGQVDHERGILDAIFVGRKQIDLVQCRNPSRLCLLLVS